MQACLPFNLRNSSVPPPLESQISDPAFLEQAAKEHPEWALSYHGVIVDIQPAPTPVPIVPHRSLSVQERKRAFSNPEGIPKQPVSTNVREYRSASLSVEKPVVVHQQWVGAKTQAKKSVSDPVPLDLNNKIEIKNGRERRGSIILPRRSLSTSMSPPYTIGSRRSSIVSITGPSQPLSSLEREKRIVAPPSPPLSPLHTVKGPEEEDRNRSKQDIFHFDSLRITCPPSPPLSIADEHEVEFGEAKAVSIHRPAKKVSFSKIEPQIVFEDAFVGKSVPSHRQSSSTGNVPRVVVQDPLKRRSSLSSVGTQAAGRSILRRTSSFGVQVPEKKENIPTIVKSISHSHIGTGTVRKAPTMLVPPSMPSLPESEWLSAGSDKTNIQVSPSCLTTTFVLHKESKAVVAEHDAEKQGDHVSHAELSQPTVLLHPKKPERAQLIQQRAVQQWTMKSVGQWVRRTAAYPEDMNEKRAQQDIPPFPHLQKNMEMLKAWWVST